METAEKLTKLKEIKPGPWSIPGDHQMKINLCMIYEIQGENQMKIYSNENQSIQGAKVKRDQARAMIYSGWPSNEHPSTVNSSSMSAQENQHVGAPFWFHLYKTFKFGWIQVDNCPFSADDNDPTVMISGHHNQNYHTDCVGRSGAPPRIVCIPRKVGSGCPCQSWAWDKSKACTSILINWIKNSSIKNSSNTWHSKPKGLLNEIEKHLVAKQPYWPPPSLVGVEHQLRESLQVFEQVFAQVLVAQGRQNKNKKTQKQKK